MSFSESLAEFRFLSELYERDTPEASLFAEYPSSNSPDTQYKNTERYIIHDAKPAPIRNLLKILGPHHLMCAWGDRLSVTSDVPLPPKLIQHWKYSLGDEANVNWQAVDEKTNYITIFPHESIPAKQQVLEPENLYRLHSKEAIEEINCPQAAIFDSITPPCIVKLSHGYAGAGNFFVYSEADKLEAQKQIKRDWPNATTIINEIIQDIIGDYCIQFYLHKDGSVTRMGFTNQIFNTNKCWAGAAFNLADQDKLGTTFETFVTPVASYLHHQGYFGVVGIDILHDVHNKLFLVDLNPRLNGSTPFLLACRLLVEHGYTDGLYVSNTELKGAIQDVIALVESDHEAKIIILSADENSNANTTKCHLSIHASDQQQCSDVLEKLRRAVK